MTLSLWAWYTIIWMRSDLIHGRMWYVSNETLVRRLRDKKWNNEFQIIFILTVFFPCCQYASALLFLSTEGFHNKLPTQPFLKFFISQQDLAKLLRLVTCNPSVSASQSARIKNESPDLSFCSLNHIIMQLPPILFLFLLWCSCFPLTKALFYLTFAIVNNSWLKFATGSAC